jgi:HSP20 family protein
MFVNSFFPQRTRQRDLLSDPFFAPFFGMQGPDRPRATIEDDGKVYTVTVEMPGLTEADIQLSATAEGLHLSGKRAPDVPEGYRMIVHERRTAAIEHTFRFPERVDSEKASASFKDGVLTITLPRQASVTPRSIPVMAN